MAWTAPMTFIPNTVLTAAQLNTHLRDNLLEQGPSKAIGDNTTGYLAVEGPHKLGRRIITSHRNTYGTTSSSAWTDLDGALNPNGPTIKVKHGTQALIMMEVMARKLSNTVPHTATVSVGVLMFGATNRDPDDTYCLKTSQYQDTPNASMFAFIAQDMTPGTTSFRLKYKVSESVKTEFTYARIIVMPL